MLGVKTTFPGLIEELQNMMITVIFGGLGVEYFYNGKRYSREQNK
jgi:hypothetical protein